MTIYTFSVITSNGFPYYQLKVREAPNGIKLYLRFFDFTKEELKPQTDFEIADSFELNAGLVSALFKFARAMSKNIHILEFNSEGQAEILEDKAKYSGDALVTCQTESYLFHKSVYAKIKLIYDILLSYKIPLETAIEILPVQEEKIYNILTDFEARSRVDEHKTQIKRLGSDFLKEMKTYGLREICITSFDLSPIMIIGKKYTLNNVHGILRNIGNIPEIPPLNWVYRQSTFDGEEIWVYIYKSDVGPTIEGLFEPYLYLLICDFNSYLGEIPEVLGNKLNRILS
ncbi:MAG: hypothetical protein HWN79_15420 [Candidatus Lokiarchaeota archaeon]|nr:hypothetical protein [Candidatus Lokiarchaeota archaeon]